jgi:uncharacterized protein with beta-barrel porin domain
VVPNLGRALWISSTTGAQGDFVDDKRKTLGGVAGLGAQLAPGVNVGFSVDQSRTDIDVSLALQSATLDLTQFGFNASVDKGPWTWAVAVVRGFGSINSRRDTGLPVVARISHPAEPIVPKVALEYVRASTDAFHEVGGLDPLIASSATMERARAPIGAEVGHYWILSDRILELSAYGKFVDNFSQRFGSVLVGLGPQSIMVQGIGESQYGADAGACASLSLTNTARLYLD